MRDEPRPRPTDPRPAAGGRRKRPSRVGGVAIGLALGLAAGLPARAEDGAATTATTATAAVLEFSGACDASAAAWIDARRFVVANDEDNVLRVHAVDRPGPPIDVFDLADAFPGKPGFERGKEADIEAAARIGDRIYWITSHGRNADGELKRRRWRFFATRIREGAHPPLEAAGRATDALARAIADAPALRALGVADALALDVAEDTDLAPKGRGLNIEGLAAAGTGDGLWIGFRNPRVDGDRALIVPLDTPAALLAADTDVGPHFGAPILLDLGGLGIRAIEWLPQRGVHLIVAGSHADGPSRFALYQLGRTEAGGPTRLALPSLGDLAPEAMLIDTGEGRALLISDDGGRKLPVRSPVECRREAERVRRGGELLCPCKRLADPGQRRFRARWVELPRP